MIGKTAVASIAIGSKAEDSGKAANILASSETNEAPAVPTWWLGSSALFPCKSYVASIPA